MLFPFILLILQFNIFRYLHVYVYMYTTRIQLFSIFVYHQTFTIHQPTPIYMNSTPLNCSMNDEPKFEISYHKIFVSRVFFFSFFPRFVTTAYRLGTHDCHLFLHFDLYLILLLLLFYSTIRINGYIKYSVVI